MIFLVNVITLQELMKHSQELWSSETTSNQSSDLIILYHNKSL